MPALSYKEQFVERVASGAKPHSIRGWRRRPFKAGDLLMHYTAMRTKACRKIRPDTVCLAATPIEVNARLRYVILGEGSFYYPAGRLSARKVFALSLRDGFRSVAEFWQFFEAAHDGILCGQLVEWNPFAAVIGRAVEESVPEICGDGTVSHIVRVAPLAPVWSSRVRTRKSEPRGPDIVGAATPSLTGPSNPAI